MDGRLQARLSDQGSHYKRRGGFLEISIARLADIAHHVGRNAPLRIEATLRGNDADARQVGKVHFDHRYLLPAQILSHDDGHECRVASRAHHHPVHLAGIQGRSEEHTSELQSLMSISYDVFCLKKTNIQKIQYIK